MMMRRWLAVAGGALLLVLTCAGRPRPITESNGILMGRVAQTEEGRVLVQLPGGPAVSLGVGKGTQVLVGGELVSSQQLLTGTDVRVTYRIIDGKPVAEWIEAGP
jgi:hypothetical protein